MRRDLVLMGTIAAIVGIGLAAGLTAALGVRSAGPPAPLRTAAVTPGAKTGEVLAVPARADRKPARTARKRVRKAHRRKQHRPTRPPSPAPSRSPVVAQAEPVYSPPAPEPVQPQPTRTVSAPKPAPAPPKPLNRPKPTNSGGGGSTGVSFDDSG